MLKETLLKWLKLDGLVSSFTGYVETRLELLKYEIREEVASAIARIILLVAILSIAGLVIIVGSIALSFKLAEYYGHAAGFALTASGYLLLLLVIILFRKPLSAYLEQQIKSQMLKK
ncbi:MAG: phage holin family protein [Cyclobacteriaceae bacterium]|nr:phage holin family protein [Cyclobacteriaceae bacterium]MDW8330947.1 phage holin family protein [Cyclobacteriaceae bacterium]